MPGCRVHQELKHGKSFTMTYLTYRKKHQGRQRESLRVTFDNIIFIRVLVHWMEVTGEYPWKEKGMESFLSFCMLAESSIMQLIKSYLQLKDK